MNASPDTTISQYLCLTPHKYSCLTPHMTPHTSSTPSFIEQPLSPPLSSPTFSIGDPSSLLHPTETGANRKEKVPPSPIRSHPNANRGGGLLARRRQGRCAMVNFCAHLFGRHRRRASLEGRLHLSPRDKRLNKSILMPDPTNLSFYPGPFG